MRAAFHLAALLSCSTAPLVACGSRGPLDDGPIYLAAEAGAPTALDAGDAVRDAAIDARRAGILECGQCLVGQCSSDVLSCAQSPGCRAMLECVVLQCGGGGGGMDMQCLTSCASGDPAGAAKILQIFQCVTGDCGPECGPLLGDPLGGGPGGGGGRGGGRGGGKGGKMTPIARAFASFAELADELE